MLNKPRYTGLEHEHGQVPVTGILLSNLGSPDAPTPGALRRYLKEFLSDPRVVEVPRLLWFFILHGIILNTRPRRSAAAYSKIWTAQGSPLLEIVCSQKTAIEEELSKLDCGPLKIVVGMRYGKPSIKAALNELRRARVQRLLVLPLYPQYASATTGSTFEAVSTVLGKWRWVPELHFVTHYHDHPAYIRALAESIKDYWQGRGRPEKLLFSFHGIPKRTFLAGDPYHCECQKTARLTAESLGLADTQWEVVFQSRFGREEWLQPYTDHVLEALGKNACARVDVVCPGFSADCLETLEEIDQQYRDVFLKAGGGEFHYIHALNTRLSHIQALLEIIKEAMPLREGQKLEALKQEARTSKQRALEKGAER